MANDEDEDLIMRVGDGEIVYLPAEPHACEPPATRGIIAHHHPAGTVWRCDCGKHWKLKYVGGEKFWLRSRITDWFGLHPIKGGGSKAHVGDDPGHHTGDDSDE